MLENWQNAVTLLCVAAALAYVVWRASRVVSSSPRSSCGSCGEQPVTGVRHKPIVTIDSLVDRTRDASDDVSPPTS